MSSQIIYADMEVIQEHFDAKSIFIFDLEFIGDVRKLHTCLIWEIAVFCVPTQQWFECVVDPSPDMQTFPPPPIPEIPRLTRAFLDEQNAITWDKVMPSLISWVERQRNGTIPVFVSHNTFRADKPILELEGRRYSMHMPLNWYFFDSLHFARRVIRNTNGNYSLNGLHEQIFGTIIENAHRARYDVIACTDILRHLTGDAWTLEGPMYPVYSTALRTIRWIGQKAEQLLFEANIRSVEELYLLIMSNARKCNTTLETAAYNTVDVIMQHRLPKDNIQNISKQLTDKNKCMYCHIFMEPVTLRCAPPSPK
jgi:DNA polymerase III epsilon subunit-like protein